MITKAIPAYLRSMINNTLTAMKIICISFPFQRNDFVFNANIGISATINQENPIIQPYKTHLFRIKGARLYAFVNTISGSAPANNALAGVANPINPLCCRSSTLNFANR